MNSFGLWMKKCKILFKLSNSLQTKVNGFTGVII